MELKENELEVKCQDTIFVLWKRTSWRILCWYCCI